MAMPGKQPGLNFTFCYVGVILIASRTSEEHKDLFNLALERLYIYGLTIKEDNLCIRKTKTTVAKKPCHFLGIINHC